MGKPESSSWVQSARWIDATRPLDSQTPVWPGDQPLVIHQQREVDFVLSSLTTTCHLGTHVDAPLHVSPEASAVDAIPLTRLVGPAELVQVRAVDERVGIDQLPSGWEPREERVLIRTDCLPLGAEIGDGVVGLDLELVSWLVARGVTLIGLDSPSVDPFSATELHAHHALARAGVSWIEGLWLGNAAPGRYLLIALPLNLQGVEAAPVRALLAPL